jgi:hypothetical protein
MPVLLATEATGPAGKVVVVLAVLATLATLMTGVSAVLSMVRVLVLVQHSWPRRPQFSADRPLRRWLSAWLGLSGLTAVLVACARVVARLAR